MTFIKKKKKKKSKNLCGIKRKAPEKVKDKINEIKSIPSISLEKENNERIKNEKPKICQTPMLKKEESKVLISEKDMLLKLVEEEGFKKVFNCITIVPLDRNNPLEKKIDDIINNIGLLRTSIILSQIKFEIIDMNDKKAHNNNRDIIPKNESKVKYNTVMKLENPSHNKELIFKNINEKNIEEKKEMKKKIRPHSLNRIKSENVANNEKNNEKNNTNNISPNSLSVGKSSNRLGLKELELGVHFQKDKNGKIYKYTKHHYRENKGNKIFVFYCADPKCKSQGCYYLESMKFELIKEHQLNYEEHSYIKNRDRFEKYKNIIEEFERRECHEAQIFKKDNYSHLVKWYDNPINREISKS